MTAQRTSSNTMPASSAHSTIETPAANRQPAPIDHRSPSPDTAGEPTLAIGRHDQAAELPELEGLYLFHLEPRYQHAGHRLGWSTNVRERVDQHLAAGRRASPLIRAQLAAGGDAIVARVWIGGDRTLESRLKRQGGLSRHCPICRATGRYHA